MALPPPDESSTAAPATVEAGGLALAFDEQGAGQPIVLVHGAAGSRTIWRETVDALDGGLRTIAYDRRAYGDSGAPEPYTATTVAEQADDLAQLIEALAAAPAVLVGHGIGAMIALDVLMRRPELARAAVLIEPPVLWLSPRGPEVVAELRDGIERGARDGGPGGAVEAYLAQVAGDRAIDSYGPERAGAARADARAFAADLTAGPSWSVTRRELRALDAPVAIVSGTHSSPVWREVSAALAALLPGAKLVEIGAGHLSHLERPEAIAEQVRALL
jgi:pimeloyl-ACP methyl ester carboxylesterase